MPTCWIICRGLSPRSFTQPYYNLDTVIDAASLVAERRSDIYYVFAGYEGGDSEHRERADRRGLAPRCRLHNGRHGRGMLDLAQ